MPAIDPTLAAVRAFHAADDVFADGDPSAIDMDRAFAIATAAERAFVASVPTTAAGVIAKLRACMRVIASAQSGDTIEPIGVEYLAAQIESAIKGLARPRLVWAAPSIIERS